MATKDITDLQVVQAVAKARAAKPWRACIDEILSEETGECVKVCLAAMHRACGRDLIDYGTMIEGAFLSSKGEELLRRAEEDEA